MTDTIEPTSPAPPAPEPGADDGEEAVAATADVVRSNPVRLALLVAGVVGLGVLFGWNLLLIVVALIVSIFLHEMGHFLVARASGMLVTEFFIGMGPRIWSFRRGEVEYGVKAFPIGAYVRIVGMNNLEHIDPAYEDRTYRAKSYPKRLATVLAGPAMNILIGIVLLYGITATTGVVADSWTVTGVVVGSAAEGAGIAEGDRLLSVDGEPVGDFGSFGDLVDAKAGQEVEVVVERDGEQLAIDAVLGWSLSQEAAEAIPSSPALREGTRVVSHDGEPVTGYEQLRSELAAADGPHELVLEIGLDRYQLALDGPVELPADGDRGFFGVGHSSDIRDVGPLDAVGETAGQVGEMTVGMVQGIGRLFSPTGLANYASLVADSASEDGGAVTGEGPQLEPVSGGRALEVQDVPEERPVSIVGIVQLGSQAGDAGGLRAMLYILAVVNLFLAFINLLPLLPFDGGHAAVATYEAIRGAIAHRPYRVDMAKLMPLTYGVVLVLMFIGLTSIWLDVRNPIELP